MQATGADLTERYPNDRKRPITTDNDRNDSSRLEPIDKIDIDKTDIDKIDQIDLDKGDIERRSVPKEHGYSLDYLKIGLEALSEESNGEVPYSDELVEYFYKVNEAREWEGVSNVIESYKRFCDIELDNGYIMADVINI